jgi:hypothetical protein
VRALSSNQRRPKRRKEVGLTPPVLTEIVITRD